MFIAHYENTMRNARPKMTPVAIPLHVPADPVIDHVVKVKPIAEKLPPHAGNNDSATRRRSVRALMDEAEKAKRPHLADYRAIIREMGDMPSVNRIVAAVCASHGMAVEDVLGRRKFKILSDARADAIRMVAEARPDLSTTQIGRFFGRDHTTILYVLGRVGVRVST